MSLEKVQVPRTSLSLSGQAEILGAGQFGQVYLAKFQPEGCTCCSSLLCSLCGYWALSLTPAAFSCAGKPSMAAVKLLRRGTTEQEDLEFMHMAQTMAVLTHDNIVTLLGIAFQHRPWLVILELMKVRSPTL